MQARNVFVSGIHTGLGHALARRLLDDGARVFAISRVAPGDLRDEPSLAFRELDLRRHERIPEVVRDLLAGVDRIGAAILNAGVLGEIKDLRETTVGELRAVMDVNVWANKLLIDAVLGLGIEVKQVVGISSGAALNGSGGWGAYAISKSALNLLLRVYSHEHPRTHFTAVAPGIIDTGMTREVASRTDDPRHPANARVRAALEEGRAMSPADGAARLLACLPALLDHPSGAYVDVRKMVKR